MAIDPVETNDNGTAAAAALIRERSRAAAANVAERAGRVERGIGDAASVDISEAARNRAGLGSAVAATETSTVKVPARRRPPSIPEAGTPPPKRAQSRAKIADVRRRDSRRQAQVSFESHGTDRTVGKNNRKFRTQVDEARAQKQLERAGRKQREGDS